MGQQLHGGLVEEDPQVWLCFGSKHDVVADVRRLSLAHEAPRHPSATFALVLVVPHPVKAPQQFCFGHTRPNSQGTRTLLLLWKTGAALFLMKSSSCGSAALGSKKVVTCGSGFSGSGFSGHSHGVRKGGRQHQAHCRLARLALALGSSRHRRLSQSLLLEQIVTLLKASCV